MELFDDGTGLEVLDRAECLRLLATQFIGRVGLVVRGRPVVMPVNYVLEGEAVLFRTTLGSNFDANVVTASELVFEIDAADPAYHTGWSVLARGVPAPIIDLTEIDRLSHLALRPWARGPQPRWVRLVLGEITGRRIVQVVRSL